MMHDSLRTRSESVAWQSAHYQEPYYFRRTAKVPRKLKRLGITEMSRDTRILDACCGRGEALAALQRLGFRNLEGVDASLNGSCNSNGFQLHAGDVRQMPFQDNTFDVVMNLHALHHLSNDEDVDRFLRECHRILKPGGILAIVDFPGSPQIRVLFWLLRNKLITLTGGLQNFAHILDEEWSYLHPYLRRWGDVKIRIENSPFETVRKRQRFFLYYWILRRRAANRENDTL